MKRAESQLKENKTIKQTSTGALNTAVNRPVDASRCRPSTCHQRTAGRSTTTGSSRPIASYKLMRPDQIEVSRQTDVKRCRNRQISSTAKHPSFTKTDVTCSDAYKPIAMNANVTTWRIPAMPDVTKVPQPYRG